MGLREEVEHYETQGCREVSLGCISMPEGYALMLDQDCMYYFWLREDGIEGPICWNRWWVRDMAIANKEKESGTLAES